MSTTRMARSRRVGWLGVLCLLPAVAAAQRGDPQDLEIEFLEGSAVAPTLALPGIAPRSSVRMGVSYDPEAPVPETVTVDLDAVVVRIDPISRQVVGVDDVVPIARVRLRAAEMGPRGADPHPGVPGGVPPGGAERRLSFDADALRRFAVRHRATPSTWAVRVTVDPDDEVFEGAREAEINVGYVPLSQFWPLSGDLTFGPVRARIDTFSGARDGGCGQPLVHVDANAVIEWAVSTNGRWQAEPVPGDLCARFVAAGGGFDLAAAPGFSHPISPAGEMGGLPAQAAGLLTDAGWAPFLVVIQGIAGVSQHADIGGRPHPTGLPGLAFAGDQVPIGDLADLMAEASGVWVQAGDLPFSFFMASVDATQDAVSGEWSKVRYQHAWAYAPDDPRASEAGLHSNDSLFRRPAPGASQPNRVMTFTHDGVATQVAFANATGGTHYPRTVGRYATFRADIADNRIVPTAIPLGAWQFGFNGACAGCADDGSNVIGYQAESPDPVGLGADGAVLAMVGNLPDGPAWGPRAPDQNATANIFHRIGDGLRGGALLVPGFSALGTEGDGDVTAYLRASRDVAPAGGAQAPAAAYAPGNADRRRGNHFMPGITVGPQLYSGRDRQPEVGLGQDLAGTFTRLGFGGASAPSWRTVVANIGTKYVLRPGGITGVFNTDVAPQPRIYGYDMRLDRFGFRLAVNTLDDDSWIDGRIDLPFRAGFGIDFDSLGLACTGHVDGGRLPPTDCEAEPRVNCGESLHAWRTPYSVQSFRFDPSNDDACDPDPRQLTTRGGINVSALQEPLGLEATWASDGDVVGDATLSGATRNELDRATEGTGFVVRLDDQAELSSPFIDEGWFTLDGLLPVPFWEALDTTIRAENGPLEQAGDLPIAGPPIDTLVSRRGANPQAWDTRTNADLRADFLAADVHPSARYTWGSTAFGIDLPIRYDVGRVAGGERARFEGISDPGFDIIVMEARAGVDYVDPERTRVSFGASADFEALADLEVDLSLDINDPESVRRADRWLASNIPGIDLDNGVGPVGRVVGGIRGFTADILRWTGAGLDDFIERAVRDAVRLATDPLTDLANSLAGLQTLPTRLADAVLDGVRGRVERALDGVLAQLHLPAERIIAELPQVAVRVNAALRLGDLVDPVDQALLQELHGLINTLGTGFDQVATTMEGLAGQVDQAAGGITALQTDALAAIGTARTRLEAVRDLLDPQNPQALPLFACEVGVAAPQNYILGQVESARQRIEDATAVLRNNEIVALAAAIAAAAGIDLDDAIRAQEAIQAQAEALQERLDEATDAVNNTLTAGCGQLLAVADRARGMFEDTLARMQGLEQRINDLTAQLDAARGLLERGFAQARGLVAPIPTFLETLAADTRDLLDGVPVPGRFLTVPETVGRLQVAFTANNQTILLTWLLPNGDTFVRSLRNFVLEQVDLFVGTLTAAMSDALANTVEVGVLLPDPRELEDHIVRQVMNSPVIARIDRVFHDNFVNVLAELDGITSRLLDQVNHLLAEVLTKLEEAVNAALAAANGVLEGMPVASAKMDGYATIRGDMLERMHVGAEWTMADEADGEEGTTYKAALDITSWTVNGKGTNCAPEDGGEGIVDARITGYDLPLSVAGSELMAKQVWLGFTLRDIVPIGIFGGIETVGVIDFQSFELFDIALAAGVGIEETYVGARGGAVFSDISLEAAFLAGRTCNNDVLSALDPQVAEFLALDEPFQGVFARGSASIPIWNNGCALSVGAGADAGAWFLVGNRGLRFGGLVGGSIWGKVACLAAIRGGVTAFGDYYDGQFSFRGDGFGAAGLGFDCDPHTWTTVSRSRNDDWCGTADARFSATYRDGWDVGEADVSAIH